MKGEYGEHMEHLNGHQTKDNQRMKQNRTRETWWTLSETRPFHCASVSVSSASWHRTFPTSCARLLTHNLSAGARSKSYKTCDFNEAIFRSKFWPSSRPQRSQNIPKLNVTKYVTMVMQTFGSGFHLLPLALTSSIAKVNLHPSRTSRVWNVKNNDLPPFALKTMNHSWGPR